MAGAFLLLVVSFLGVFQRTSAECANACNGHGRCTSYDMCICNRNWQAADCSERVCAFGLAHVDTPKGDLDGSGSVSNANKLVIENNYVYPYGTTEQFPQMQDSDLEQLPNSAHFYMECSNKGTCDRKTGECQCYDGYDGVACQRASCPGYPNSCSGHGVCKTIRQLAQSDHGNVYELWDRDSTMGCDCDPGYSGPDCSLRQCKYGVDPLYLDDSATVKYPIFHIATLTTLAGATASSTLFTNGETDPKTGYWALRFFDMHGEDWITSPIRAGATCSEVTEALYNLPNDVIPPSSLVCTRVEFYNGVENIFSIGNTFRESIAPPNRNIPYRLIYKMAMWEARTNVNYGELSPETAITQYTGSNDTSTIRLSGFIYQMKFTGNPGKFPQPEIEVYLDGNRPTLVSPGAKVITKVWTDGQQGESNDYIADYCEGVTATIGHQAIPGSPLVQSYLTGFSRAEKNLLKKCLGDSDFDCNNNQDVYNWDFGNRFFPHLIKLVRTVSTYGDGGFYAVLWYDTSVQLDNTYWEGTFKLLNPFVPPDNLLTDVYDIYTTKGTLALTSNFSEATFGFASRYVYTVNTTYDFGRSSRPNQKFFDGDLSCETGNNNKDRLNFVPYCLDKNDLFLIFNWKYPELNPPRLNMYTVDRLYTEPHQYSVRDRFPAITSSINRMHYMTHMITTDLATNWGASVGITNPDTDTVGQPNFQIYKFFPSTDSTYEYVAECSNRGICERDSGVCKCFPGYTSDSCSIQDSLSL